MTNCLPAPPADLTPRQHDLFVFLTDFIKSKGYAPTFAEMGSGLGIRSTNAVSRLLDALVRKGWVTRPAHASRAIRLQVDTEAKCCPHCGKRLADVPA